MYREEELIRIKSINKKLNNIFGIIERHGGIVKALKDDIPTILEVTSTILQNNSSNI